VVTTKTGAAGTYLADGTGKALYLFVIDTAGKSMCNGPCATQWPPLTTTGKPTAGSGATASMLSTITRDDGSTQVAYNGHPLYHFEGDSGPGTTAGQGVNAFGGLWWLVSPAGAAIQK
jgi:predicted lipoprotein with Yx(FWY)xxD motif